MAAMTVEQRFDLVLSAQQIMQLDSGLCFSARESPYEQGMYKHPNIRVCARRCSAVCMRITAAAWEAHCYALYGASVVRPFAMCPWLACKCRDVLPRVLSRWPVLMCLVQAVLVWQQKQRDDETLRLFLMALQP